MRKQYDFSKAQPNPYAGKLKKQITIRLELSTIDYFKGLAKDLGIPYQNLINLYLRDCAFAGKRPTLRWSQSRMAMGAEAVIRGT
jgi:predicted DNA binding CopG/RHH family protein